MEKALTNRATIEDAGGLFISCTALPAFEMIEYLEAELGVPVVSSNQATLWNTLNILKVDGSAIPGGRLFRLANTRPPVLNRNTGSA
jgi:maleate isomerase